MKKAVIYVFSGTGNTRFAAEKIAEELGCCGVETVVWEVRAPFLDAPDPNQFDLAGFGYPVHAFNTPRFFLRFVKTLPRVQGIPAFLFKTSGEPFHANDASSWPLVRLLRKKGFQPKLDRHLLMPYNIMFRYPDALAKQMYLHTGKMARVVAAQAVAGEEQRPHYYPWTVLWMYLFRLQWFGAWLNGPLLHAKKEACVGCGQCEKRCPAGNIQLKNGVPRFSSRCTMCMGCVFHCPKDAIRPGILNPWRLNGAYPFERLVGDERVPDTYVNSQTRGYFRLFQTYYRQTGLEIQKQEARESKSLLKSQKAASFSEAGTVKASLSGGQEGPADKKRASK